MIERFYVRTATITNPAIVNGPGSSTELDYQHGTRTTARGWLAQLSEADIIAAGRDGATATHVFRTAPTTPVTARSRVTVDGTPYVVVGTPGPAWTPRGEHHLRVLLRSIDG